MRRRAPGERVEPWRHRNGRQAEPIAKDLARWAQTSADQLGWPDMPDGIEDRNADVWEALLAVADLAGDDWPDRARGAAVALVAVAADQRQSLGIQLLTDLRTVFMFGNVEVMATETILDRLHRLEESPWNTLLHGRPLDARGLANKLRRYEIKPKTVRLASGQTAKGYRRDELADVWARYLSPSPDSADTSDTTSQTRSDGPEDVSDTGPDVSDGGARVTDSQPSNHAQRDGVTDVTDKSQDGGPPLYTCRLCGNRLMYPLSQQRGVCERCYIDEQRKSDP
jgi:hypothetical protein